MPACWPDSAPGSHLRGSHWVVGSGGATPAGVQLLRGANRLRWRRLAPACTLVETRREGQPPRPPSPAAVCVALLTSAGFYVQASALSPAALAAAPAGGQAFRHTVKSMHHLVRTAPARR